jgi:hypothetical protein
LFVGWLLNAVLVHDLVLTVIFCLSFVAHLQATREVTVVKDAYNFFLSQMWIQIEMAFGLLCNKWRILQRPLQVRLKNAGKVFICCAKSHHLVINERLQQATNDVSTSIGSSSTYGTSTDYDKGGKRSG